MKTIFYLSFIFLLISCDHNKKTETNDTEVQIEYTTEVPRNPFLFENSSQPIVHFNSAQTDATINAMPEGNINVQEDQVSFIPASIAIPGNAIKTYNDGSSSILTSTNSSVMKVRFDHGRFDKIDEIIIPGFEQDNAPGTITDSILSTLDNNYMDEGIALNTMDAYMKKYNLSTSNAPNGLYTFIDNEGHYYAGYKTSVFRISDIDKNKTANSKLEISASVDVTTLLEPEIAKTVSRFVGINVTYDGHIVIAMPGLIAVLDRELKNIQTAVIEGEAVDNGIAIDPEGGIYVVTSKYMRKLIWNGKTLSMDEKDGAWKETYAYDKDKPGLWLSRGSGATPVLMGFGNDSDKLVFIPDAGSPVKLNAYWRNEIPEDAKLIEGAKSRRLAATIPIGYPIETTVEWSPHVYKNGIMTFASDFPDPIIDGDKSLFKTLVTMGYTRKAPIGADKLHWDEKQNILIRDWTYLDRSITWTLSPVSVPNNAVYLNTLQEGKWIIKGIDWDSGEEIANISLPNSYKFNCAGGFIYGLPDGRIYAGGMFGPTIINLK